MLVAFVASVAGEVLHAQGHRAVPGAFADPTAVGVSIFDHRLVVVTEGSGSDHGVAPVVVDVHDGCERPVATQRPRLAAADHAHQTSGFGVGRRGGL